MSVRHDRPERARDLLVRRVSLVPLESLVRLVSLVRLSELALPIYQLAPDVRVSKEEQARHTRIGVIVGIIVV